MDVAAVNADSEQARGPRERIPVAPSALDEERLLIAELTLKPLGHLLDMSVDCGPVRLQRQHLGEHVDGHPKGRSAAHFASR
jgi:hypothetical protein